MLSSMAGKGTEKGRKRDGKGGDGKGEKGTSLIVGASSSSISVMSPFHAYAIGRIILACSLFGDSVEISNSENKLFRVADKPALRSVDATTGGHPILNAASPEISPSELV